MTQVFDEYGNYIYPTDVKSVEADMSCIADNFITLTDSIGYVVGWFVHDNLICVNIKGA